MMKQGMGGFFEKKTSNIIENNTNDNILDTNSTSFRVLDIILDDTHPKFQQYGGWNGIGTIEFEPIDISPLFPINPFSAKPLFPSQKSYPLVNEIVIILTSSGREIHEVSNSTELYYITPLNLWNHPHHNAYPNATHPKFLNFSTPNKSNSFVEKVDIRPLLSHSGDNILEGRFGNSLRLGNTSITDSSIQNQWSKEGNNGDPITILRNGQAEPEGDEGWVPVVEDINHDKSSIYLTSNQKLPLEANITSPPTLSSPLSIMDYQKPQIILTSNRLVLNSKKDSIILDSKKSTSISSLGDIGIFSRKHDINIQGNQIRLGGTEAYQPLVLGNKFIDHYDKSFDYLIKLIEKLSMEPKIPFASAASLTIKEELKLHFSGVRNTLLSKTTKTI